MIDTGLQTIIHFKKIPKILWSTLGRKRKKLPCTANKWQILVPLFCASLERSEVSDSWDCATARISSVIWPLSTIFLLKTRLGWFSNPASKGLWKRRKTMKISQSWRIKYSLTRKCLIFAQNLNNFSI